jgi:hypothetical protein
MLSQCPYIAGSRRNDSHYSDEKGQLLDADGAPYEEVFSTIVPLLVSDQILVEDPETLLEGSNVDF